MGTFGVELCAPSLASPNRNESNPGTSQEPDRQALYVENSQLRYVDLDNHGYVILDITNYKLQADFYFTDTKTPSLKDSLGKSLFTYVNQGYLQEALAPAMGKEVQEVPAPSEPLPFEAEDDNAAVSAASTFLLSGVYPNPSNGQFFIGFTSNQDEILYLEVLGVDGKRIMDKVLQVKKGNQKIALQLETMTSGLYVLNITTRMVSTIQEE